MIKIKHIFHDNTSTSGNGTDYHISNKSGDSSMVISCGDFYGKATGSNVFVAIQAIQASDYTLVSTGSINESYLIDMSSYEDIRVALSNADGNVTVIGEVVE